MIHIRLGLIKSVSSQPICSKLTLFQKENTGHIVGTRNSEVSAGIHH